MNEKDEKKITDKIAKKVIPLIVEELKKTDEQKTIQYNCIVCGETVDVNRDFELLSKWINKSKEKTYGEVLSEFDYSELSQVGIERKCAIYNVCSNECLIKHTNIKPIIPKKFFVFNYKCKKCKKKQNLRKTYKLFCTSKPITEIFSEYEDAYTNLKSLIYKKYKKLKLCPECYTDSATIYKKLESAEKGIFKQTKINEMGDLELT